MTIRTQQSNLSLVPGGSKFLYLLQSFIVLAEALITATALAYIVPP